MLRGNWVYIFTPRVLSSVLGVTHTHIAHCDHARWIHSILEKRQRIIFLISASAHPDDPCFCNADPRTRPDAVVLVSPAAVSVVLKERRSKDSVTLAWQGPERPNGVIVEYEVIYYEKVSGPDARAHPSFLKGKKRAGWRTRPFFFGAFISGSGR